MYNKLLKLEKSIELNNISKKEIYNELFRIKAYINYINKLNQNVKYKEIILNNNKIINSIINTIEQKVFNKKVKKVKKINKNVNDKINELNSIYNKINNEVILYKKENVENKNLNFSHIIKKYEDEYIKCFFELIEINSDYIEDLKKYLIKNGLEILVKNNEVGSFETILEKIENNISKINEIISKNLSEDYLNSKVSYNIKNLKDISYYKEKLKFNLNTLGEEYSKSLENVFNKTQFDLYPIFKRNRSLFNKLDLDRFYISIYEKNDTRKLMTTLSHEIGHAVNYDLIVNKEIENKNIVIKETIAIVNEHIYLLNAVNNDNENGKNRILFQLKKHINGKIDIFKNIQIYKILKDVLEKNNNKNKYHLNEDIKKEIIKIQYESLIKYQNFKRPIESIDIVSVLNTFNKSDIHFESIIYYVAFCLAMKIVENIFKNEKYLKKYIDVIKISNTITTKEFIEMLELDINIILNNDIIDIINNLTIN